MTTLATDPFTGTGTLGANWTDIDAGFSRVSDQASFSTAASAGSARYTGVAFPDDQWAQVVIGTTANTASDEGGGPIVRGQAGGNVYLLQGNTVETRIYKRVGGSFTQLGTDGAAIAPGDTLYLEIQGTQLIAKKNDVTICGSPTDAAIATGSAGIWGSESAGGDVLLDNFSGGDFAGGGGGGSVGTPVARRFMGWTV